jgi:hypothetical protein
MDVRSSMRRWISDDNQQKYVLVANIYPYSRSDTAPYCGVDVSNHFQVKMGNTWPIDRWFVMRTEIWDMGSRRTVHRGTTPCPADGLRRAGCLGEVLHGAQPAGRKEGEGLRVLLQEGLVSFLPSCALHAHAERGAKPREFTCVRLLDGRPDVVDAELHGSSLPASTVLVEPGCMFSPDAVGFGA